MSFFTKDWKYKLVALVLAVMLWWTVQGDANPNSHQKFIVPVTVRNLDADKSVELTNMSVTVDVNDKKLVVENLSEDSIEAYVDVADIMESEKELEKNITEYNESTHEYNADIKINIKSKYTFRVRYKAYPTNTVVKVVNKKSKSMLIDLQFDSIPPTGYTYNINNMPVKSVIISGQINEINKVNKVQGIIANIPSSGFYGDVSLVPFDKYGKIVSTVTLEPTSIQCSVSLKSVKMEKFLLVEPVFINKLPNNLKIKDITINPNSVMVKGLGNTLSNINTIKTNEIDLSKITSNTEIEIPLKTNDNLTPNVKNVKLKIKVEKIK